MHLMNEKLTLTMQLCNWVQKRNYYAISEGLCSKKVMAKVNFIQLNAMLAFT